MCDNEWFTPAVGFTPANLLIRDPKALDELMQCLNLPDSNVVSCRIGGCSRHSVITFRRQTESEAKIYGGQAHITPGWIAQGASGKIICSIS